MCSAASSLPFHQGPDNTAIKMGERLRNVGSWQPLEHFTEIISAFCNEYPRLISCPKALKWLITLSCGCSPWPRLHLLPRPLLRYVGQVAWGCLCLDLAPLLASRESVRLEKDWSAGKTGKLLWGFQEGGEGSQKEKCGRLPALGTHRALSEARAGTQHRCWKRLGEGIKKGGGAIKKKWQQTHLEEQTEQF